MPGVFRESLPEMLGGLGVALVVGIVGIIYSRLPVLVERTKAVLAQPGAGWIAVGALAMLGAGLAIGATIAGRKRRRIEQRAKRTFNTGGDR